MSGCSYVCRIFFIYNADMLSLSLVLCVCGFEDSVRERKKNKTKQTSLMCVVMFIDIFTHTFVCVLFLIVSSSFYCLRLSLVFFFLLVVFLLVSSCCSSSSLLPLSGNLIDQSIRSIPPLLWFSFTSLFDFCPLASLLLLFFFSVFCLFKCRKTH